ncbi:MAG: tetratricopeptide repeat protein [Chloroflexi bacterium]|nr:MAG: tetratricopeptide repeat protein [Chloroflexota bacterium]
MNASDFLNAFDEKFNETEFLDLCFTLGVKDENLPGEGKRSKMRELTKLMQRKNQVAVLLKTLQNARPDVPWHSFADCLKSEDLKPEVPENASSFLSDLLQKRPFWLFLVGVGVVGIVVWGIINFWQTNEDNLGVETPQVVVVTLEDMAQETAVPQPTSTNVLVETAVPTTEPTQPAPPTSVPLPTVAPVSADEIMVLVAEFEPLIETEKEVARFIVEDLQDTVENIPFSNIRIRKYPSVITTKADAVAAAKTVGAMVVVWGKYHENHIDVEIQIGSLQQFPNLPFGRDFLDRTINTRVKLVDVIEESVSMQVVGNIIFLQLAGNESPARISAIGNEISDQFSDPSGDSIAALLHRFSYFFFEDEYDQALAQINEALALEGDNPLLYELKGILNIQLKNYDDAVRDLLTAKRLKPQGWITPNEALGFVSLFQGRPDAAIEYFAEMTELIPEQWVSHYNIGLGYYLAGDYKAARQSMNRAIELDPDVNWPYIFAVQIALREGELNDAVRFSNIVLQKFPDPSFGNRVMESSLGDASVVGTMIAGYGYGLLAQYENVIQEMDKAIANNDQLPELHWMRGFAHCNLQEYEAAELDFSTAIERDPSYNLPYLSRAEIRLKLGNVEGAQADIDTILHSEQADTYSQILELVETGALNCQTLLSFNPLQ